MPVRWEQSWLPQETVGEPKQFLYLAFTLSLEGLEVVSVRQDGGGQEVDACDPLCGSEWEVVLEVVHASGSWLPTGMVVNTESKVALCDPIDGSPPGPAVPGILQARTLEWVAISFSNARK